MSCGGARVVACSPTGSRDDARRLAVHELTPFDAEETEMVRAEIRDLAEWLGAGLVGLG